MLVFEGRGKPEYPEKNLLEKRREQTNSTHKRRWCLDLNLGHIGGRQALSPLCHPLLPKIILSNMFWSFKGVRRTTQGVFRISMTGMIEWGKNQNPKKSHTEFPSHKNFHRALKWYNTKNRNISFKYPPKSLLKSSYPKKSRNPKFQTPKPFNHPRHLKSGVLPLGRTIPGNYGPFFLPQKTVWLYGNLTTTVDMFW